MKRLCGVVVIVALLAIVSCVGFAIMNRASQPVVGSNVISSNRVMISANSALVIPIAPVLSAANPRIRQAAVSIDPVLAVYNPQPPSNETPNLYADTSTQISQPQVADAVSSPVSFPPNATFKIDPYAQIILGSANLMNNVWGAPSAEAYSSGIYQNADNTFGWYWTRQAPIIKPGQTCVAPIFPSIRIGGTGPDRSRSAFFPIKLANAKTLLLDVTYDYPQIPSGTYDLAYDLFLSDASQPNTKPRIAAEVMVWLDATAKQPSKSYVGDFTDGTNTFALYSWTMADGRAFYSFVLKSALVPAGHYQIDAGKLLDQIKLDSNWLIHGIEFGTEVYNGSGRIHINRFGIVLNGTLITQ